jgi:hypothetical protein
VKQLSSVVKWPRGAAAPHGGPKQPAHAQYAGELPVPDGGFRLASGGFARGCQCCHANPAMRCCCLLCCGYPLYGAARVAVTCSKCVPVGAEDQGGTNRQYKGRDGTGETFF